MVYDKIASKWVLENIVLSENCDIEYSDVEVALRSLLKECERNVRHQVAEMVLEKVSCVEEANTLHREIMNLKIRGVHTNG